MNYLNLSLPAFFFIFVSLGQAQSGVSPKVGMLLPLTGSYASGGVDNQRGVEAALSTVRSSVPIEIVYADSKADPATGVSEFRSLTGVQDVLAVYVMRGSVGMPLNPISQSLGVSLLGGAGNKDFTSVNKYAFQVWSRSDEEGAFLAQVFQDRRYDSVALITVQDDWQSSVSEGFLASVQNLDLKVVSNQEVLPTESDFRSSVLKIKSASPKVVFANLGVNQMASFLRQAKDLGLSAPIYCNFWVAKKDVVESAGSDAVEGVRFVEMDTNLPYLVKFVAEQYSAVPSGATLSAYASTLLLMQAVSASTSISSKEELYRELLKQREIRTPDGAIPIVDRGVKFPLKEKVLKAGKVEVLSGAE